MKYLAKSLIDDLYLLSSLFLDNKNFECKLTLLPSKGMVQSNFLQQQDFLKKYLMWIASRTGLFTNFYNFFQLKKLEIDKTKKRIKKKKQRRNFEESERVAN